MMIDEDYVTYEQAEKLKELGFDWEVIYFYDINEELIPNNDNFYEAGVVSVEDLAEDMNNFMTYVYSAPTLSQAQKWLREVKGICIELRIHPLYRNWFGKVFDLQDYPNMNFVLDIDLWDTYEQALSAGIDKALELLQQQSNG